jgi:hypothetical protein
MDPIFLALFALGLIQLSQAFALRNISRTLQFMYEDMDDGTDFDHDDIELHIPDNDGV